MPRGAQVEWSRSQATCPSKHPYIYHRPRPICVMKLPTESQKKQSPPLYQLDILNQHGGSQKKFYN